MSNTEKEQKILELLNDSTLLHNHFVSLNKKDYQNVPESVWFWLYADIERLGGKLEMLNSFAIGNISEAVDTEKERLVSEMKKEMCL